MINFFLWQLYPPWLWNPVWKPLAWPCEVLADLVWPCSCVGTLSLTVWYIHTLLGGPSRPGFTVHPLKLVEVRSHFDLIHDPLLQPGDDHAALRRDLYLLGLPWPGRWESRCLPVDHSVALDELGLPVHLREVWRTTLLLCSGSVQMRW